MRILYIASAIEVGGRSGGATHVGEVACGLHELGHKVGVMQMRNVPNAELGMLNAELNKPNLFRIPHSEFRIQKAFRIR